MLVRILSRTFSLSNDSYSTIGIFLGGSVVLRPKSGMPVDEVGVVAEPDFSGALLPVGDSADGTAGFASGDLTSVALLSVALLSAGFPSAALASEVFGPS